MKFFRFFLSSMHWKHCQSPPIVYLLQACYNSFVLKKYVCNIQALVPGFSPKLNTGLELSEGQTITIYALSKNKNKEVVTMCFTTNCAELFNLICKYFKFGC